MGFFPRVVSSTLFFLRGSISLITWFVICMNESFGYLNTKYQKGLLISYWNLTLIGMTSVQNPCTDFCHINQMTEDLLINVLFHMGYGTEQWAYQQNQLWPCFRCTALQLLDMAYLCAFCLSYTNMIFYSLVQCHKNWRNVVPHYYYRPICQW